MMFEKETSKIYALTKKEYISVSIVMPTQKKENSAKESQKRAPDFSSVDETHSRRTTKNVDVEDLFSDVWTKKISKKTQKERSHNLFKILNKKTKLIHSKHTPSTLEKIELTHVDKTIQNQTQELNSTRDNTSSGNEINEYFAKINSIVYQYFVPPQNSQGHSVKSVIELNSIGKVLDFRILTYSGNEALNRECDQLKSKLSSVVFPINPLKRSSRTIVILTSKE